jgi:hypothetical protein
MQRQFPRFNVRHAGTGPFFDYVLTAMHHQAVRARALRAALALRERRVAESRQTSAEQRWEGEGGSMRECTLGGRW